MTNGSTSIKRAHGLSWTYLDKILKGCPRDATIKQYPDINTHISIAHQLYRSLLHLALEYNGYCHPQQSKASTDTNNAPNANLHNVSCNPFDISLLKVRLVEYSLSECSLLLHLPT